MKFRTLPIVSVLALALVVGHGTYADSNSDWCDATTTIESIIDNPGNFEAAFVTVLGNVTQFTPQIDTTTSFYLLQGKFGNIIKVNTANPDEPRIFGEYCVSGTVFISAQGQVLPFIVERNRFEFIANSPVADFSGTPFSGDAPLLVQFTDLSTNDPTSWQWDFGDSGTSTLQNPSHTYNSPGTYTVTLTATNTHGSDNETKVDYITVEKPFSWAIVIAIAIGILVIVGIIILILRRGSRGFKKQDDPGGDAGSDEPPVEPLETIRITPAPPTVRLIPGKLEIISDCADKGRDFQIAGKPTAEGNIVTIGRAAAKGGLPYTHIHLAGYQTVSREQAQLIERQGTLYIKNLGKVNPTQVNDVEVPVGEEKVLNAGDEIRLGELVLKYLY